MNKIIKKFVFSTLAFLLFSYTDLFAATSNLKLIGVIAIDNKETKVPTGVASIKDKSTGKIFSVKTGEFLQVNKKVAPMVILGITQKSVTLLDAGKNTHELVFEGITKISPELGSEEEQDFEDYEPLEDDSARILELIRNARQKIEESEASATSLVWPPEEVREIIYCDAAEECFIPGD